MPAVRRSALVTYSPEQMFDLVRDVRRYPDFLGWVDAAAVHDESEQHQVATLELSIGGVSRRITTENRLVPGRRLEMKLCKGPFEQFEGLWTFAPLDGGSRVELALDFHFDSPFLAAAFNRGFARVADRLVDDFCRRAENVYGRTA